MSSTSETGHAKNVANIGTLIITLEGFGEKYKPSKESIQLSALRNLETRCNNAMSNFKTAQPPYTRAISDRDELIKPLNKLATRIVNALMATDAPAHIGQAAQSLAKKIAGTRIGATKTEVQKQALAEKGKSTREISTSQTSIDSRLENFDKLIKLLEQTPEYMPNEEELQTASLIALCSKLKELNQAAVAASKAITNARTARNEVLYDPKTGIITTVQAVRKYLRSVFTVGSSQYKQISKLSFRISK